VEQLVRDGFVEKSIMRARLGEYLRERRRVDRLVVGNVYGHASEIAKAAYFKLDQSAPIATVAELANYDAIVVGAPTRFESGHPVKL
jgi:hypothetical protein